MAKLKYRSFPTNKPFTMIKYGVDVTPTDTFGDESKYQYIVYDTQSSHFLYIDPLDNSTEWVVHVHTVLESDKFKIHEDHVLIDQVKSIIDSVFTLDARTGEYYIFPVIIESGRKMAIDWETGFCIDKYSSYDVNNMYAPYVPITGSTISSPYVPVASSTIASANPSYGFVAQTVGNGGITFSGNVTTAATITTSSFSNLIQNQYTGFHDMHCVGGVTIDFGGSGPEAVDGKFNFVIYDSSNDVYLNSPFMQLYIQSTTPPKTVWEEDITQVSYYYNISEDYDVDKFNDFWHEELLKKGVTSLESIFIIPLTTDEQCGLYIDFKNSQKLV